MGASSRAFLTLFYALPVLFCACTAQPPPRSVPVTAGGELPAAHGVADEIRRNVETGSPRSLAAACALIQERNLGASDFGRLMNAAAAALFRAVYADFPAHYLPPDPPLTAIYTRILRSAERGVYTLPRIETQDFLECALPFLAFYYSGQIPGQIAAGAAGGQSGASLADALPALERAVLLNPDSVLPYLFRGLVYEREKDTAAAAEAYRTALEQAADCYPAELGLIRIMEESGERETALARLSDLLVRYPDNIAIKKELARSYAAREKWNAASALVGEILQRSPRDGEFLLLQARLAMEQGRPGEAAVPLDTYATIDSTSRDYLFLRARFQAEYNHNRESALNYLRSIVRSHPDDAGAQTYMAGLLIESPDTAQAAEGRAILSRLLARENPSAEILSLAVRDTIRREAWRDASGYLRRLLALRRSNADLLDAYRVERGLGNNGAALSYAREAYNRPDSGDDDAAAYITALIDTGRRAEAARIIAGRLSAAGSGGQKSRYYYLRSRLDASDDEVLADLRSSLFEDPRNFDALSALFDIYHRRGDTRRAAYYLKQALAVNPAHSALRRYETEYRARLGSSY